MSPQPKIVCQCGGEIARPIPMRCPHCGAVIVGMRLPWWKVASPLLGVALMFAALLLYVWWLMGRL